MSFYKRNEVRILIFDDRAAEQEERQRPGSGFSPVRALLVCQYYYSKMVPITKWYLVAFLNSKW